MKALHAPQHMGAQLDANLDTILALDSTVADLTEQDGGPHDNVDRIRAKVGHRYHVLSGPANDGHARENVILVRKRPWRRVGDVEHHRLSDPVGSDGPNPGIGNDRHLIVVPWRDWGRLEYAHVATHWNAAIQNHDTGRVLDIPRARVMELAAGPLLEDILTDLYAQGVYVTGGADFNYRDLPGPSREWRWAPYRIFTRVKYLYRTRGLDYQWWSRNLVSTSEETIAPGTGGNHADHPWLLTTLKRVRRPAA